MSYFYWHGVHLMGLTREYSVENAAKLTKGCPRWQRRDCAFSSTHNTLGRQFASSGLDGSSSPLDSLHKAYN
jgi:hypothetical protein